MPRRGTRLCPCPANILWRRGVNKPDIELTLCDREPIHIPGSIQPHGILLVADRQSLRVTHAAGNVEAVLGRSDWSNLLLIDLIGPAAAEAGRQAKGALRDFRPPAASESFDATYHV